MSYQQYPPYPGQQQQQQGGGFQPQGYNPYQQQPAGGYGAPQPNQGPYQFGGGLDAEAGVPKREFGFNDQTVRVRFVRKVFTMVAIMLSVVTVMTALPFLHQPTMQFLRSPNTGGALYLCSYLVFIVTYIVLMCCENVRRAHPTNLILMGLLTVSIGFMTMMIASHKQLDAVLLTLVITTICCGGIILFSMQTRIDFTNCLGVMVALSLFVMVFGLVAIISALFFHVRALMLIYAGIAALLFMFYLAIDVQMLMGGRTVELSPEEHVFAAIQIFIDIIYIFWMLLMLFGGNNN